MCSLVGAEGVGELVGLEGITRKETFLTGFTRLRLQVTVLIIVLITLRESEAASQFSCC